MDKDKIILEALIEKLCRDKPHIGNLLESLMDCNKKELETAKLFIDELIKQRFPEE